MRKKIPALREALEGPFEDEHGLIVGQILAHIDFLDPSLSTSGETLTIEELLTLRARTETAGTPTASPNASSGNSKRSGTA